MLQKIFTKAEFGAKSVRNPEALALNTDVDRRSDELVSTRSALLLSGEEPRGADRLVWGLVKHQTG